MSALVQRRASDPLIPGPDLLCFPHAPFGAEVGSPLCADGREGDTVWAIGVIRRLAAGEKPGTDRTST